MQNLTPNISPKLVENTSIVIAHSEPQYCNLVENTYIIRNHAIHATHNIVKSEIALGRTTHYFVWCHKDVFI